MVELAALRGKSEWEYFHPVLSIYYYTQNGGELLHGAPQGAGRLQESTGGRGALLCDRARTHVRTGARSVRGFVATMYAQL